MTARGFTAVHHLLLCTTLIELLFDVRYFLSPPDLILYLKAMASVTSFWPTIGEPESAGSLSYAIRTWSTVLCP